MQPEEERVSTGVGAKHPSSALVLADASWHARDLWRCCPVRNPRRRHDHENACSGCCRLCSKCCCYGCKRVCRADRDGRLAAFFYSVAEGKGGTDVHEVNDNDFLLVVCHTKRERNVRGCLFVATSHRAPSS